MKHRVHMPITSQQITNWQAVCISLSKIGKIDKLYVTFEYTNIISKGLLRSKVITVRPFLVIRKLTGYICGCGRYTRLSSLNHYKFFRLH